jgi:hypothetical protein
MLFRHRPLFDFFDLAVKILISCRDDNQNDFICAGPVVETAVLIPAACGTIREGHTGIQACSSHLGIFALKSPPFNSNL